MDYRLSKLENWILNELNKHKQIDNKYVYETYYTDDLEYQLKNVKDWRKRKELRTKKARREHSIIHAFNQLFLKKLVVNSNGCSYDDIVKNSIEHTKKQISELETEIKNEEITDFLSKCWLGNLYDYLYEAEHTEIISAKKANEIYGTNKFSGLVCCGSQIHMWCYPKKISKKDRTRKLI